MKSRHYSSTLQDRLARTSLEVDRWSSNNRLLASSHGSCQAGLFLGQDDSAFIETGLIFFSSSYCGNCDTSAYPFRTNLSYFYDRESALARNIRKNLVCFDLVPLNDRVPYHYNSHTTTR